jgi:hypothetical protein
VGIKHVCVPDKRQLGYAQPTVIHAFRSTQLIETFNAKGQTRNVYQFLVEYFYEHVSHHLFLIHRQAPLEHRQAPLEHRQAPLEHRQAPLEHRQAPLEHRQAPLEHRQAPLEHRQALLEHRQAPLEHRQPPLEHKNKDFIHQLSFAQRFEKSFTTNSSNL